MKLLVIFLIALGVTMPGCKKNDVDSDGSSTGPATGFAEIKGVRITATRIVFTGSLGSTSALPPGSDSCLVNLRTGKVYALKDGAANASNIDILLEIAGNSLNPDAIQWASPDYYNINEVPFGTWMQKWGVYRNAQIQDWYDKPINLSEWDKIKTAADIARVNTEPYDPINGTTTLVPMTLLVQKSLYAFITPEGRRGIMKFTGYGKKSSTLYWATFDVKIQK